MSKMHFKSVVGVGTIHFVNGAQEKSLELKLIEEHCGGMRHDYDERTLEKVCVLRFDIVSMICKMS